MRHAMILALPGVLLALIACAHVARIDGSTAASFEASHKAMVDSLELSARVQLALAEQTLRAASTPDTAPRNSLGDRNLVPLVALRSELSGMDYASILQLARSKHVNWKVGCLSEPSSN